MRSRQLALALLLLAALVPLAVWSLFVEPGELLVTRTAIVRRLYVTPGVGTSIVPVRFRVPPEVSLVILRSSPSAASG